jgi:hypothetical protein
MTITVTVPDTQFAVLNGICQKQATITNLRGDEIEFEVEGQKYKALINDVVPADKIKEIQSIFRHGKIAWIARRLRKII